MLTSIVVLVWGRWIRILPSKILLWCFAVFSWILITDELFLLFEMVLNSSTPLGIICLMSCTIKKLNRRIFCTFYALWEGKFCLVDTFDKRPTHFPTKQIIRHLSSNINPTTLHYLFNINYYYIHLTRIIYIQNYHKTYKNNYVILLSPNKKQNKILFSGQQRNYIFVTLKNNNFCKKAKRRTPEELQRADTSFQKSMTETKVWIKRSGSINTDSINILLTHHLLSHSLYLNLFLSLSFLIIFLKRRR